MARLMLKSLGPISRKPKNKRKRGGGDTTKRSKVLKPGGGERGKMESPVHWLSMLKPQVAGRNEGVKGLLGNLNDDAK